VHGDVPRHGKSVTFGEGLVVFSA